MKLYKYNKTLHLPWSESVNNDDKVLHTTSQFEGRRVIVTEKMDGENTTMYPDYIHARSTDSRNHPSRNWVKALWGSIKNDIPQGWRICGENLYAKHSIYYTNLPTYFMGFSIWNDMNICLNWDDTLNWFSIIGITPVPVLYDDIYNESKIKNIWGKHKHKDNSEGYVLRIADNISNDDFSIFYGKFVRKNHVQTSKHWMNSPLQINGLAND